MQATVVKALLPVTATIPITLLVFNDPEGSPEIKEIGKIPHSNVILEVEDNRLVRKPKCMRRKSVSGKARSVLCEAKTDHEAKTDQKHRKPLILQKRGSLLKPVIVPEKRDDLDSEAEIVEVEIEPDIVECTSTQLSFSSLKNKSLLRQTESLSQAQSSSTPATATRKEGSLLKPVIASQEGDALDGEAEIVEVEPDIMECTSTGLSISPPPKKSLNKPGSLLPNKCSLSPVTTTQKRESRKPVMVPDKGNPLNCEKEILVIEPDIAEFTSKRSSSSQRNKSLLKPEIVSQNKFQGNPAITTRKEGSLLKPVIMPGEKSPPHPDPEMVEVEPDRLKFISTGLTIPCKKNKSLLRPESLSQDKCSSTPATTTRKGGSLLKPILLPEKKSPLNSEPEIEEVEPDILECTTTGLSLSPYEEKSFNEKLLNFKNAASHIVTTARPAKSLLKPAVVSNAGSLLSSTILLTCTCSRKEQMEITRRVEHRDEGAGSFSTRLCGGDCDSTDVELPTAEWQLSGLNDEKRIIELRKTSRNRSLLKKQNQATKKILSTSASVPTEETHPRMDYYIDEAGAFVFDCTRRGSGNGMNKKKRECSDTPSEKQMNTATQRLAVLKSKLKKTKEKLHSRHRRVSCAGSKVAQLKNLIADLKSRDLITESALARLNEAVDHSLSVFRNTNFYDDLTTDT